MAKPTKPKPITSKRLSEILGISVFTLTDWKKRPNEDSRFKIYTLLKSMSEEDIIERTKSSKENL